MQLLKYHMFIQRIMIGYELELRVYALLFGPFNVCRESHFDFDFEYGSQASSFFSQRKSHLTKNMVLQAE